MKRRAILLLGILVISIAARAEIEKLATPGDKGFSLTWWPKAVAPDGWHHDREHSLHYGFNALAPDKFTFANAESVMYAKAIYKPREPELKSLEMLVERDKRDFLSKDPTLSAHDTEPLETRDGKKMRSIMFVPKANGNWERVAYGEKGEFYLVFVVSSRTEKGYRAASKSYEQWVRQYREKP